jgi:hypothetical protein
VDKQSAFVLSALLSLSMLLVAASSFILEANAQLIEVKTSVHLVADRYQGYVGQFFRVNITVEPPPPPSDYFHRIIVSITKPDGATEILKLMTNNALYQTVYGLNSSIWFEYVVDQTGIFTVSAKYTGDNYTQSGKTYLPSTSNTLALNITHWPRQTPMPTPTASLPPSPTPTQGKKTATLSLDAEKTGQTVDSPYMIKGRLWAPETVGIAIQDILVSYRLPGESTWTLIGSPMTNEWGKYDFRWTPPLDSFVLKAEWAGNSEYYPASNTTTISKISIENQQAIIQSNSTITQITYKQTVGLSFTVNGETGTVGYAKVILPKSLMPESQNIKVYIDDKAAEFGLSAEGDSWVIGFTYSHSMHQVSVTANSKNLADIGNMMWVTAGIVAAALAVVAGVIVWLAKNREK